MTSCIGWDIGGAHLKGALVHDGRLMDVAQFPCPLWLGLDHLRAAFAAAKGRLRTAPVHVATMTGELADLFENRREGVRAIAEAAARALAPDRLLLYAGAAGFVPAAQAAVHAASIASANWHATASLVARKFGDALLVDLGSTTTDIVPIAGGAVRSVGRTDAERLGCGELVYTGLTRTPVMSLTDQVPFAGAWTSLACEHFATTADVYRVLEQLPDGIDQMPTADGRDRTLDASIGRLARMVGRDAADAPDTAWRSLASALAEAQLRRIADAAALVLSRATLPEPAPIVAAGIGIRVIERLADRLGRSFVPFDSAANAGPGAAEWSSACAPAVAVALLHQAVSQPA